MASNNLVIAAKPAFDKLVDEMIVLIMSFTDPKDIIALRRVCRRLATASRQRIVWSNALRLVSEQHGIYMATFRILEMTIVQLQHAATSPARFTACLQRELRPPKKKLPTHTERVKPKSIRNLPGDCCFERAFLVPGGRYILTMSYTRSYLVELWDIGFSTGSVRTPSSRIAYKDFKGYIVVIVGLQPTATRDGLLVMLEVTPDNR